ncbi:dipeptidylaminopeptidase/acylaminoacyl-peptidase-like protein [Actinosynnema mirum DSM 43827]|uniref:Dipeptidylaminopeptidase/acylaminoacyl-peptidase-like protein n=2 Tax=Actinosynnema mirum TaxID=40567 RepID=C6WJJ0_ACTMD|nr:dipeptidylaminopeptidase/acylaminoacyl-peptidase-like protein [Actinosynnema mirum DSM 43827]
MRDSSGVRSNRLRRIGAMVVAASLVLTVAASGGIGWHYSEQLLNPATARPGFPDVVLGASDGEVVLADSGNTAQRGTWGLVWPGGELEVGDVASRSGGEVRRPITKGTAPAAGTRVRVEGSVWASDPRSALGLDYRDVSVPTELGDAPAWLVPGSGGDGGAWVVAVHGRAGTRAETLRALPVLHDAGLTVLSITYRNDDGAPASPDGLYHLGDSEWRDAEAAVRYARDSGAGKIVLYGWSMGGAIAGQLLARSELAGEVSALVLDAPVTSWTGTLELQSRERGVPTWLVPLAELVSGWRADLDFSRFDLADHPPAHRPPTLLVHGDADTTVPVQGSRDLAARAASGALDWDVRYVEVPGAAHVAAWNADRARYERELADFVTSLTTPP